MVQADTNPITRRNLISGTAAAAATLPALPALAVTGGDDAKLMRLCEDLRRAWAFEKGIEAAATDEEMAAAVAASGAIVEQIEGCTATTIDGLRVKALAVLWCHGWNLEELTDHQTTDIRLAQSILRDLLR